MWVQSFDGVGSISFRVVGNTAIAKSSNLTAICFFPYLFVRFFDKMTVFLKFVSVCVEHGIEAMRRVRRGVFGIGNGDAIASA